jgi:hypothetical protein
MIFRNAPKCCKNVTKEYSWPMELLCGKCCVNRCKVTYFYIVNQFQKLSEASSIDLRMGLYMRPEDNLIEGFNMLRVIWTHVQYWLYCVTMDTLISCFMLQSTVMHSDITCNNYFKQILACRFLKGNLNNIFQSSWYVVNYNSYHYTWIDSMTNTKNEQQV